MLASFSVLPAKSRSCGRGVAPRVVDKDGRRRLAGLFTLALDVKWRGCNVWAKVLVKKRNKDARIDVLKNKENDCSS